MRITRINDLVTRAPNHNNLRAVSSNDVVGADVKLPSEYLTVREAAAFLKCTPAGLARYRYERRGPPFVRVGKRVVRYRLDELVSWMESHKVSPAGAAPTDNLEVEV
jgi:hypothetical protein